MAGYVIDLNGRKIIKMYDDIDDEEEYRISSITEQEINSDIFEAIFADAEYSVSDIETDDDEGSSVITFTVKNIEDLDADDFDDVDDVIDAIEDVDDTMELTLEVDWVIDDDEALIDESEIVEFYEDLNDMISELIPCNYADYIDHTNFYSDDYDENGHYDLWNSYLDLDISMNYRPDGRDYQTYFTVEDGSGTIVYTSSTMYDTSFIECYAYASDMPGSPSYVPEGTYTFHIFDAETGAEWYSESCRVN